MYAPIYFPPAAPPSEAVRAEERAILAAEGPSHVAGRYIADSGLAATARRHEAERRVDAAERASRTEARWLAAHRCAWCGRPVVPGTAYEVLSGEPLHARPCRVEFEQDAYAQDVRPYARSYGRAA
ncbi:hypothetical protein tb265_49290 [Gemmatimonadetes bacterium T265]|nr:hypothetical protein tb265_49290 [Gemmatimonadetes bacterium T265]